MIRCKIKTGETQGLFTQSVYHNTRVNVTTKRVGVCFCIASVMGKRKAINGECVINYFYLI
jgi:hypothetical protein